MAVDFRPRTVFVSGTYGAGKSMQVCNYLHAHVHGQSTMLAIAYRQSQALDLAGKMHKYEIPFTLYLGHRDAYIAAHKSRMLISTQSLSKICPLLTYDVVVIDEITSLLMDSATSSLVPRHNFDMLLHLIRTARKLIVMDVNLPVCTTSIICALRQATNEIPNIQVIPKPYTNKVIFMPDLCKWKAAIVKDLHAGNNVVICSDSKKNLIALCDELPQSIRKRVYSAGHPYTSDLDDVNSVWTQFQLIAYSPSITTATSFVVDHFHTVYGLYSYCSLSARAFAQQLHRVRNIASGKIVVHASAPKAAFLRNQVALHKTFDPASGNVCEAKDIYNEIRCMHNAEIQRTHEDFKGELAAAMHT